METEEIISKLCTMIEIQNEAVYRGDGQIEKAKNLSEKARKYLIDNEDELAEDAIYLIDNLQTMVYSQAKAFEIGSPQFSSDNSEAQNLINKAKNHLEN